MTIWNLGSVNADKVYRLPHLPEAGETLAATGFQEGLGGKGANMSVAAVRAGSHVEHIGAVGRDGIWMRDRLASYGVGVDHLKIAAGASGHAVIALDGDGENQIILHPGANMEIESSALDRALSVARAGDIAICQNETNAQADFVSLAHGRNLRVVYAAAPFSVDAVQAVLGSVDLLVLNQIEAQQLEAGLGMPLPELPIRDIVVTLGGDGCRWIDTDSREARDFPAPKVDVVDSTGAGDTFTGYLLAELDRGAHMSEALDLALRAGSVMVTRLGTADAIPTRDEIQVFFR